MKFTEEGIEIKFPKPLYKKDADAICAVLQMHLKADFKSVSSEPPQQLTLTDMRRQTGLSKIDLGKLVGVSRTTIGNLENKPDYNKTLFSKVYKKLNEILKRRQ